jgi:transposase
MHYPVYFRKRVLEYSNTHTIQQTAKDFRIARGTISNWRRLIRETKSLKVEPVIRKPRKLDYNKLIEYVEANPDRYLREIAKEFKVATETIRKALHKLGITLKKKPKYTKNGMNRGERSIPKRYQSIRKKI